VRPVGSYCTEEIRSSYGLKMEALHSSEKLVPSTLLPTLCGVTTSKTTIWMLFGALVTV
jgi:hypothetical protein